MAHLLGNRYCIESLRNDVTDLQGAVVDVFSRAGPVRFPSWKYPDKTSCDLDLTELLEIHDYSEDEEERQVAHIVLLELVIDRLVLLLQSMSKYTDQMLHVGKGGPSPQSTSHTSIGLVVKKYWHKMVQLGANVQQLQTENKNKSRTVTDLENTLSKMMEGDRNTTMSGTHTITIPLNDADASRLLTGTSSKASDYSISCDECIKATQTLETAFVPCESCDLVQKHLREVGNVVVDICNTQDLPCSLARHKKQVEKLDWMCGTDIARWATEQNKDLTRINKHLSTLHGTIEPLQTDLEKTLVMNRQLTSRVSECAKEISLERETQSVQQKQYEQKYKKLQSKSQDDVNKVQRQNEALQKCQEELKGQVETMNVQLQKREETIKQIERAKQQILTDMEAKMTDNEHVHGLETDLETTQQQLSDVKEQLNAAKKELNREKAKGKSVSQHTDSLQNKQESLVSRLDAVDRDNEDLRQQVSELEDQQDDLQQRVDTLKDEKRLLNQQLRDEKKVVRTLTLTKEKLEQTTEELRSDIHQMKLQVQEAQEHEHLLVDYPDLNGPVNPDLTGTGNILVDMENQVKANSIRISILEDQNNKLRNSISKMLSAHQQSNAQGPGQPVPLWKAEESVVPDDRYSNVDPEAHPDHHSPGNHWNSSHSPSRGNPKLSPPKSNRSEHNGDMSKTRESFVVGTGPRSGSRPPSGKLVKGCTPQSTTSINTYKQLRKAGLLKVNQPRPPSAKVAPPSEDGYQPSETFSCAKCDKMYNSARDLEVHRLYCYGGI